MADRLSVYLNRPLRSMGLAIFVATALVLGVPALAHAVTVYVANNGLDTATCGVSAEPCRSISQGIARGLAQAGRRGTAPRIVVRPGRYGDLDHDGTLTGPGEEASGAGTDCDCLIRITHPVIVESEKGSAVTVLDPGFRPAFGRLVSIEASEVVFGSPHKGFTLIGTSPLTTAAGPKSVPVGIRVAPSTADTRVGGNLVFGATDTAFLVADGVGHRLESNFAVGNLNGFVVNGHTVEVTENVATRNGLGFVTGFGASATNHTLLRNVATDNGDTGFFIAGAQMTLRLNTGSGNRGRGFVISATDVTFRNNQAIGNTGRGIHLLAGATIALLALNNIVGNDPSPVGVANCGLFNESGVSITANKNWWGSPTGAGPEPADQACGPTPTTVAPPLTSKASSGTPDWF